MPAAKKARTETKLPAAHDWRTSDTDEINKRRFRARKESFDIANSPWLRASSILPAR